MGNLPDYQKFCIPSVVSIDGGRGGLPRIAINGTLASAEIYLHGAHITHFAPKGHQPVLFLSSRSAFESEKPIRGGIPLIFPWFGPGAGPTPRQPLHGFARIRPWQIEAIDARKDGSVRVVLTLASDVNSLNLWPAQFTLRLIIIVAAALEVTLEVKNTGKESVQYEEALHTYLSVGDARKVSIRGLEGVEYSDRAAGGLRNKQLQPALHITCETDRAYLRTRAECIVEDPVLSRKITVSKENSDVTVVWNPWIAKSAALADLGADAWPNMLCVEAANALDCAVNLAAGATHRMATRIAVSS